MSDSMLVLSLYCISLSLHVSAGVYLHVPVHLSVTRLYPSLSGSLFLSLCVCVCVFVCVCVCVCVFVCLCVCVWIVRLALPPCKCIPSSVSVHMSCFVLHSQCLS